MKLRIETNIKLTDYIDNLECNFNKIKKLANKITLVINHVDMSVIKDRGIPSKYIYDINYEPTGIDVKRHQQTQSVSPN